MKKRKARRKLKRIFRKSTPKSSSLYKLATDYKLWYVTCVHRCDCFFTNFANLKRWAANKLLQNSKQTSMHSLVEHKTVKSCSCTKRNCASKMKLLKSGDIELNPGPEQNVCDQTALSVGSTVLLNIDYVSWDLDLIMLVVQVTVFLEPFHISCMVIQVITCT